ncbi:SWIM zinc finger family protein [Mycoplasma sp. P36-A1]|uniref:SWIM zinc finger family protein n=1 Tax=Mycoplasma sp. P36-A1 TaxID=3252900 RepID=UPI003C2EA94B
MEHLKEIFEYRTWIKGEKLYNNNEMYNIKYIKNTLTAAVQATEKYKVEINIHNFNIKNMKCNCPVAKKKNNCEHIVALLFEAINLGYLSDVSSIHKQEWAKIISELSFNSCIDSVNYKFDENLSKLLLKEINEISTDQNIKDLIENIIRLLKRIDLNKQNINLSMSLEIIIDFIFNNDSLISENVISQIFKLTNDFQNLELLFKIYEVYLKKNDYSILSIKNKMEGKRKKVKYIHQYVLLSLYIDYYQKQSFDNKKLMLVLNEFEHTEALKYLKFNYYLNNNEIELAGKILFKDNKVPIDYNKFINCLELLMNKYYEKNKYYQILYSIIHLSIIKNISVTNNYYNDFKTLFFNNNELNKYINLWIDKIIKDFNSIQLIDFFLYYEEYEFILNIIVKTNNINKLVDHAKELIKYNETKFNLAFLIIIKDKINSCITIDDFYLIKKSVLFYKKEIRNNQIIKEIQILLFKDSTKIKNMKELAFKLSENYDKIK